MIALASDGIMRIRKLRNIENTGIHV